MQLRNQFPRALFLLFALAGFAAGQSQSNPPQASQQQAQPQSGVIRVTTSAPANGPAQQQGSSAQNQQQSNAQQAPQQNSQPPQQQESGQMWIGNPAYQGSQAPAPQPQQPAQPAQQPANQTGLPGGRSVDTIQMAPGQQPGQAQGQSKEPTTTQQGGYIFHAEVEEVQLYATVVDDKGRIVTDLPGCGRVNTGPCGPNSAFTVYQNGQPVQIKLVERRDVPVALGILIDNSGSMREKRQRVNIAALDLVKSSNPDDKVFVVNFNDTYYLDQDFTSSVPQLKEALEKIESRGGTALYDAVVASADYLEKSSAQLDARDHIQKKALFVVTDGEDNMSTESLEQTVRRLSDENAPTVYTIGILDKEDRTRKAKRALQAIAEQTGGLAFFPKDASEVDEIARTVARDIRSQYVIVFKKPQGDTTPGYRQIKVVAHAPGHKNLQVRTLSGYYSGTNRASR